MAHIQCFFLEPTDKVSVKLRRYAHGNTCPHGYHDASTVIASEPIVRDEQGYISNNLLPTLPHDDPRWPTSCACGYVFQEQDEWQRFTEQIYRRTDTCEEMSIRNAPVGAMWYAEWLDHMQTSQDETGHPLMVKTPGGDWVIDSQSANCTMPDDIRQERHHCWIRHGVPPLVTVDKSGQTCGAGAGSIQCNQYHGFLRNGFLED